jgi:hypothetical protein
MAVGASTAISMRVFHAQGINSSTLVMVWQGREHIGEPGSRIDVIDGQWVHAHARGSCGDDAGLRPDTGQAGWM